MVQIVDVIIDMNSMEISPKSGGILSTVYFRIDDKTFPDEGWSDFTVVLLGWWLEELSKLEGQNKIRTFKLNFMDGPLFVKGYLREDKLSEIEFTKDKLKGNEIFFTAICDIEQLKMSILKAARELLQEIDKRGLDNNDIKKLRFLTSQKN